MKSREHAELPAPDLPGWYSTRQLMDIFSVSRQAVSYWAKTNKLRYIKSGPGLFFNAQDVEKLYLDVQEKREEGKKKDGPALPRLKTKKG